MRIAEPLPLVARRRRGLVIPAPSFNARPLDEVEKDQAVCLADPDLWFSDDDADQAEARRLCGTCPLASRCLAIALAHRRPAVVGIWAGTTEKDRAVIRPAWRRARQAAEAETTAIATDAAA